MTSDTPLALRLEDIINAIPGGVAVYKVSDRFETVYFSDVVPELSGYTVDEYYELSKGDAAELIYREDTGMVVQIAEQVIRTHETAEFEFRKQHRDGHIVWVRVQVKWSGEEDGCPLLLCVFHNISELKEAQLEMRHLINSIPGGIASYRVENHRFIPTFFSDGVMALSGHTRAEYEALIGDNALNIVYVQDRERVMEAEEAALSSGEVLDVSYRMRHKDGGLVWIHLNGRRMGPLSENTRFYAVFTGMSLETRLFQSIANEMADSIYIIAKDSYDLLYVNEPEKDGLTNRDCVGRKCYEAIYGNHAPCDFCGLTKYEADGREHEMKISGQDRFFSTRFRETDWNGIPAYVKYVRDITEEVRTRREKERLEQYFQTVVKNLPGGIAVVKLCEDGSMVPEFVSEGFAELTGMSQEEISELYSADAMAGVNARDLERVNARLTEFIESGASQCELVYRLKRGDGSYVWVKNNLSLIEMESGERKFYAVYHDISGEIAEKEQLRQQYKEMIMQHYRTPDPNALIIGHCNITQNQILEIIDHTDSDLLKTFSAEREKFFAGISSLVTDEKERQIFLDTYLNEPTLRAFGRNDTEQTLHCFIKLPKEEKGRHVKFKVNLVETPDTGDVTGILTVTDITDETITNRILHQLSVTSYDFVIDLDLINDTYKLLAYNKNSDRLPDSFGSHSKRIRFMAEEVVVPKDREQYWGSLEAGEMKKRLMEKGSYTFAFSITDEQGDIRTKNMTVSAIDLRIGRACLVRSDITESLREQQGLLNMIAYTFELACFINMNSTSLTMYTRETVLKNLAPYYLEKYEDAVKEFALHFGTAEDREETSRQFRVETMVERLGEKPEGYDFVFPYEEGDEVLYKQINVLWGDENHRTICMVRADVTDMLAAERQTKRTLEKALVLAEEANQAKSEFLSAMSHDIRTPMNAIMGMTALACAHIDDQDKVSDCLKKISISSRHLLSLINDVLDMSKIERSQIALGRMKIHLPKLMDELAAIIEPQAKAAGIQFHMQAEGITNLRFYGDMLRLNQIFINILSNAIKFTPEGGSVGFLVEELPPVRDDGYVRYCFTIRDTGVGMKKEFLKHIFEPFSRSSNTSRVEGTGLGLSITKGLVDLMGGVIIVESKEHQGTVFQVILECEKAGEPDRTAVNPDGGRERKDHAAFLEGRRFLIAEDNAINAEILCELLEMYGASSLVKTDGLETVKEFADNRPGAYDAILMDIQMPEMNGYEATRAIRRMNRPDAADIPIIAMTANAFAEDIQASMDAGMTAHVAKPIDVSVLQSTLCRVLGIEYK